MTRRECFLATMQHRQPVRTPIDIGGTPLTGIRPGCQARLRDLLGFSGPPVPSGSGVDERLLRWAGTDFRCVGSIVGLPKNPRLAEKYPGLALNEWGMGEINDGRGPRKFYPLANSSSADLKAFPWPEPRVDEQALASWQAEAKRLKAEGEYVVIAHHPVFGILELGCWMCGYDHFLLKMAEEPDFVRYFFDRFHAIQEAIVDRYYDALGPYIDMTISGDDFGTQNGPMMSPAMFEELVAPYFRERIRRTKQRAPGCIYWHHSCGSVARLLDGIIECGVEILNPIQTSAAEMDPEGLKRRFGDRIVFWGAVDVQQFLPNATADEIRDHIPYLLRTLGRDGGYVMAPAHEILDDVPAETIVTWVETLRDVNFRGQGPSPD